MGEFDITKGGDEVVEAFFTEGKVDDAGVDGDSGVEGGNAAVKFEGLEDAVLHEGGLGADGAADGQRVLPGVGEEPQKGRAIDVF